jgi:hypothetical protein
VPRSFASLMFDSLARQSSSRQNWVLDPRDKI